MAKYRFEQIAINSTEKKKPVEEDRFTYLGLEHLDSGSLKVTRFGSDVAPIGEKLVMRKGDVLFGKRRAYASVVYCRKTCRGLFRKVSPLLRIDHSQYAGGYQQARMSDHH